MRRALSLVATAALIVLSASPALAASSAQSASSANNGKPVVGGHGVYLAYDFSDNSAPASASGGPFVVIVDVVPSQARGYLRVSATPPEGRAVGISTLFCKLQPVYHGAVMCNFSFTTGGTWSLKAQYFTGRVGHAATTSLTSISVAD